jgi:hypothetical protein
MSAIASSILLIYAPPHDMSIERARSNAEPTRSNHWSLGEKQEAQPLAPGIPHYLGSGSKKRARVGLRSREMSVAITRNLSERNRANTGNVL